MCVIKSINTDTSTENFISKCPTAILSFQVINPICVVSTGFNSHHPSMALNIQPAIHHQQVCLMSIFNMITYILVKSSIPKKQIKDTLPLLLSDDEEVDDELFNAPSTFHGYEIHMLKKWSMLTLSNVDIQKSKYGYYIKNLTDEHMKTIIDGFVMVHPKLNLTKREIFLRSHANVKIIDSYGNELQNITQISGQATKVKIDLQGYKIKKDVILPIWRINEILCA